MTIGSSWLKREGISNHSHKINLIRSFSKGGARDEPAGERGAAHEPERGGGGEGGGGEGEGQPEGDGRAG